MSLKPLIEKLKREHAERLANAAWVAEKAEKQKQERDERAAASMIKNDLPTSIEEAIAAGRGSVEVYSDSEVPADLDACIHGVLGELVKQLSAQGLRSSLWIDVDCSGNYVTRNSLMLKL